MSRWARLSLASLTRATSLRTTTDVWNVLAQGGRQIYLMVLLLHQDSANLFRHGVFSQRFTLPDAIAVIANGFVLVFEVEPQHVFRIFRSTHGFGSDRWHFPEIIDLPRDCQSMIKLLLGMDFELVGDVHIFRTAEHLG